jgi:hypothetical protein
MRRKTEVIAEDLYNEANRINSLLTEAARRLDVLSGIEADGTRISTKLESNEYKLALIDRITELTEEWFSLITRDHHKDRDCHWTVETQWSYGQRPRYKVLHYGYILREISEEYCSYADAVQGLHDALVKAIENTKNELSDE